METLFAAGPSYDPHLKSVMSLLLSRLRNNNPKPESKAWSRNAGFLMEIYEGRFLSKPFDTSRKDYDYQGSFDKIRAAKGSWQAVRSLVVQALDNIELAKDFSYMPFNKKFVESITFSTFFEHRERDCFSPGVHSNFVNFVNPPLKKSDYSNDSRAEKLKASCVSFFGKGAAAVCSEHFSARSDRLRFWEDMAEWKEWLSAFKAAYPEIYSEFAINCAGGSPFEDYWNWLAKKLANSGRSVRPYHFQLSAAGSERLGLDFLDWLEGGVRSGKFAALRGLPRPVALYRFPESFGKAAKSAPPKEKEVVDADDFIF